VSRNVVAEVGQRRPGEGWEPDRVDAERPRGPVVQMVESRDGPLEVADPVAIRVLERPGIDLIEDAFLPPHRAHRLDSALLASRHERAAAAGSLRAERNVLRVWSAES